jgi:hypothetical protein
MPIFCLELNIGIHLDLLDVMVLIILCNSIVDYLARGRMIWKKNNDVNLDCIKLYVAACET